MNEFEKAIREIHNGYHTDNPPEDPQTAINDLCEEATDMGRIEMKIRVMQALGMDTFLDISDEELLQKIERLQKNKKIEKSPE